MRITDLGCLVAGALLAMGLAGCARHAARAVDAAVPDGPPAPFTQTAYIKASNTDANDIFGIAVALSQDGKSLISGALGESSSAHGVDGDQHDNSEKQSGAAYVFDMPGGQWAQTAYVKSSNTHAEDELGGSVGASSDGATIAVSSVGDCSASSGINEPLGSCTAMLSGAVLVFAKANDVWAQQAFIKASNATAGDEFGDALALAANGSTLVVGDDLTSGGGGAVDVFVRSGDSWAQQADLKASNSSAGLAFGYSVTVSGDGNTLVVGTPMESSAATGVDGSQTDGSAPFAGAAYVFVRADGMWTQQAYLKASNTEKGDGFGTRVALSADGSTLVVSATEEASSSPGVDGNQADDSLDSAGAVYVFARSGSTWAQQAYVKASNPQANADFGFSLSLSADGSTLLVGAYGEASWSTGVNGNETDDVANASGAAYVFTRSAGAWQQEAYVKASNTDDNDRFGWAVSLAGDGSSFVIGAPSEASSATGIDGAQDDNRAASSGAVYVFDSTGR